MAESSMQTLDQRRAAHAWKLVERVSADKDEKKQANFGTQAKKLPMRILASGLGQALAFLQAKKGAPDLLTALTEWMNKRRPKEGGAALLTRIITEDADFLRFATAECLAYLQWVVRFADAKDLTDKTE